MNNGMILAIESSCDETAAAIIRNGHEIVSNVVASQIESHKRFGGVVPEIASRHHVEQITMVIEEAFSSSKSKTVRFGCGCCYRGSRSCRGIVDWH